MSVALYTYTYRNIELQVYIICRGMAGNLSLLPVDLPALPSELYRNGGSGGFKMAEQQLYTMTEAARILAVTRQTLYRLYHKGQMAFVKVGTGTRISADELARYIQEHSRRGTGAKQEA